MARDLSKERRTKSSRSQASDGETYPAAEEKSIKRALSIKRRLQLAELFDKLERGIRPDKRTVYDEIVESKTVKQWRFNTKPYEPVKAREDVGFKLSSRAIVQEPRLVDRHKDDRKRRR